LSLCCAFATRSSAALSPRWFGPCGGARTRVVATVQGCTLKPRALQPKKQPRHEIVAAGPEQDYGAAHV
jgi:hypothetical protein